MCLCCYRNTHTLHNSNNTKMLPIAPFRLERYFGVHEFSAKHLLSSSDCESRTVQELVGMADAETKSAWDELKLGYTESQGLPQLRHEIAQMYSGNPQGAGAAVSITADDVVIGAPEELIFIAMSALLTAGDHVVCLGPAYQSLHEVARAIGCDVDMWNLRAATSSSDDAKAWELDWDALSSLIRPTTRMIVFNAPHNPTGFLPSAAEQRRLVDVASATNGGLIVFSDEMYRLLEFRDAAPRLPSTCTLYRNAVTLSGMSKAFGLPGLRIGWLASGLGSAFVHKLLSLKDYTTICSSGPSEVLSWIGLRASKQLTDRNQEIVRGNTALLQACCAKFPTLVKLHEPDAGSTTLVQWVGGAEALETFCADALKSRGLMIVPGSMFDSAFAAYFRVGLGRADFSIVLSVFEDLLRERTE